MNGYIGEHLAIQRDASLVKSVNELAVGQPMIPGRRIDPYDPQASEVPFPVSSITVGIGQRFFNCHTGLTNEVLSPTPITGSLGKEIFSFLSGVNRPFYSGHLLTPFSLNLNIGDQFPDILLVSSVNQGAGSKAALPLLILAGQDVAGIGSPPLDFAGPGLAETLGCSPVCFDLGHFKLH